MRFNRVVLESYVFASCHILPVENREHIHSLMLSCWILIGNCNINVPFFIFSGYLLSTGKLYYALALLGLTIPQVFFQVYLTVLVAPFFFVCVGTFFCSRCFHVWSKVPFSLGVTRFKLFELWGISLSVRLQNCISFGYLKKTVLNISLHWMKNCY